MIKKTLLIIILALLLWAGGFAWFVSSSLTMPPQRPDDNTDAIVVLTGGDQRIETGLKLFTARRTKHLFITGVHPDVTRGEIAAMEKEGAKLPPCCITLGKQATTTTQNAQETKEWIASYNYKSIRLVTANYHMHRALLEFHHMLPDVDIIAHPVVQPDLNPDQEWFWILMLSEYHKTIFRWLTLLAEPAA